MTLSPCSETDYRLQSPFTKVCTHSHPYLYFYMAESAASEFQVRVVWSFSCTQESYHLIYLSHLCSYVGEHEGLLSCTECPPGGFSTAGTPLHPAPFFPLPLLFLLGPYPCVFSVEEGSGEEGWLCLFHRE